MAWRKDQGKIWVRVDQRESGRQARGGLELQVFKELGGGHG